VSDDLRTQYLLGYYAPTRNPDRDADITLHSISIKLKDAGLSGKADLRYRKSYYDEAR
jgi:Ca-activated chloride channel homolog